MARERKKSAKQQAADAALTERAADAKREQEERRNTPEILACSSTGNCKRPPNLEMARVPLFFLSLESFLLNADVTERPPNVVKSRFLKIRENR